ncbi:hypothetical protein MP638_005464 [Amoeboaphelidium occidentale]|nr:hypothetical protein MP638_005464 [Amoeboaphelidium occidentale]
MVYYQLASAALNIRCEIILPEAKFQFPDQCVVIANHQSSLDLFIMAYFWPQKLAVIAKESMKYYPILGWHLALAQNIFIRRQQRDKALQAMAFAAKKIVENKVGVFLFPEGTRSHTDKPDLLPFKKGAFHLASQAKVPIIPVVAASYGDIYSSKHFRFNDGVIMIRVLEPVPVDDHHVETVENLMDQCRSKMQEALSELKCIKD